MWSRTHTGRVDCRAVQVLQANSSHIWSWLEYAYAVVLLATLTQGPVLKVWEASSQFSPDISNVTKFATYLLVQIPALLLLSRRGIPSSLLKGPVGVLLAFVGWMLLSTLWATSSSNSLVESVALVVTCLAGLYIAQSFTLFRQLSLFLVAMQPGLILSWFAVRHDWSNSLQQGDGDWIGIYFNRNSLAPPAALGMLAALGLLWIVLVRRSHWWVAIASLLVNVIILDGSLLLRSGSSTSLGAILVFGIVWIFWTVIRWVMRRRILVPRQLLQTVYPSFLLGVILLTWAGFSYQRLLLRLLGNNLDFSGRTILWRFSWDGFTDRPLIGWGWMSAWQTPNFFHEREFWWALTDVTWSHSALMDVLLGGGIVGAVLLIFAIVWSGARQLERVCTQTAGQWSFAATWFVLAASTQDSFIVGNHFMWLLLVASMTGHRDVSPTSTTDPVKV